MAKCYDTRKPKCFAKVNGECTILNGTYKDNNCPFYKVTRNITNGIYYPYNPVNVEAIRKEGGQAC